MCSNLILNWTGFGVSRPFASMPTMATILAVTVTTGCASTAPDRAERMTRGYVYYLDGAGGGGITNWASGVRKGLRGAGYDGAGEMFSWQTGLGFAADQTASNNFKRSKASKLAQKMVAYHQQYPHAPMTLMGLSAGTAVAVFTPAHRHAGVYESRAGRDDLAGHRHAHRHLLARRLAL